MSQITIELKPSEELKTLLEGILAALKPQTVKIDTPVVAPVQAAPVVQQTPPPIQAAPVVQQTPPPVQAPPAGPAVPPTQPVTVPTAAPSAYTLEQLSLATAPLMDAGKINELSAMLQSFGVRALTELNPAQYDAVAIALRGMGAKI